MITRHDAELVSVRLQADGFRHADTELVLDYARSGSVPASTVGTQYDEELERRLEQELDEYELEL